MLAFESSNSSWPEPPTALLVVRSLFNSAQPQLVVTNIIGVFIDDVAGGNVTGYFVTPPPRW